MKNHNILIVCTGNSARSIIGEVIVSSMPGFKGYSAGTLPRGEVHPMAESVLRAKGHEVDGLRSKSWTEFAAEDAPHMELVITVCENAGHEDCPVITGDPAIVHWSLPDPLQVEEMSRIRAAFEDTYETLRKRLGKLFLLDFNTLSKQDLKTAAQAIQPLKPSVRN